MKTTKPIMQNAVLPEIKVKSTIGHGVGTLLHDSITLETYEVLKCVRIDYKAPQYGLTLKEIK